MSSAICFNLDQSKILSSGNGLSDSFGLLRKLNSNHTKLILTILSQVLMTLGNKSFENFSGKEEKAGNHLFLLFPPCFLPYQD